MVIAALLLSFLFTQSDPVMAEESPRVYSYIYIDGTAVEVPKNIDEVVLEVINGKWGNGTERVSKLAQLGYDYSEVQGKVNEIMAAYEAEQSRTDTKKVEHKDKEEKNIDEVVLEVISGEWGNGTERANRLAQSGHDYSEVQDKVNEIMVVQETEENPVEAKRAERKDRENE